jgi:hypothetical protein
VMAALHMPAHWYETTVGNVDLFVLDPQRATDPAQTRWLQRALASSEAAWKIAVVHTPAFSCSAAGGAPGIAARWAPLFRRYGVRLLLSGNHHSYQRFRPDAGITSIVTGNGGAQLFRVVPSRCPEGAPELVAHDDDHRGFLFLAVNADELSGVEIASDGAVLDTFSLPRPDPARATLGAVTGGTAPRP